MNENSQLPQPDAAPRRAFWRRPWFWLGLVVLGLAAWQWWAAQTRLEKSRQELTRRLAESEKAARDSQLLLSRAMAQTEALQQKYGALAAKMEEFQGEAEALRGLYQEAALTRDDALLAEVEQNINIAVQHLQLSGNTQLAILALTAADERLARAARPQFLPLRRALAHDLETLKMTPFVDLPGMSLRLESVMVSVDKLPLLLAFAPPEAVAPQNEEAGGKTAAWGMKFLRESWQEIRGMVRIQRFDRKEPVLLSTQQDLILRENIKLRLLNARLALLSHDQWTFHNELKTAHSWLTEYFNSEEKTVQAAMATLEQLAATEITVELPHPGDSLGALQTLKANRGNR